MSTPPDSTLDIAGGDIGLSRHLKDSLRLLAKRSDEPAFSRLIDDVLSGKRSLREAYTDPPYTRVMDAQVHAFADRWDAMSEEEKEELARVSEHQLPSSGSSPTQRPRKGFVATMTTSTSARSSAQTGDHPDAPNRQGNAGHGRRASPAPSGRVFHR